MLWRTLFVGVCALLVTLTGSSAPVSAQMVGGPGAPMDERDRGDLLEELALGEEIWRADPCAETAVAYAMLLLEAGRFESARGVLTPVLEGSGRSTDAVLMAARLDYYMGHYPEASAFYREVLEDDPGNMRAAMGLVMAHYQTNAYESCAALPAELLGGVRMPHLDIMRAMGETAPYEPRWDDGAVTEVPLVEIDPLPIVEVEINGLPIFVIIDTGADLFILDTEIAESLGMETIATMEAMFAGGMRGELGFGMVDSLRLGGVTLRNVPVSMLPTKPLSLGEQTIGGIIGVGVLKQFLSTMDYPEGRLVLRARSAAAVDRFREEEAGRIVEDIPFYIASTHFLLTHGSLNGYDGLLFHVDSGLAGLPSFGAPEQTLGYVGIPIPEVQVHEGVIGGGGGGFAVGTFDIAELGLGDLIGRDLLGSFGGLPPDSYWRSGFIIDGLVSHNFLRDYAWTLDFDGQRMSFAQ